jgi:hypothetical protein
MQTRNFRRAGAALAAVAVLSGAAACSSGQASGAKGGGEAPKKPLEKVLGAPLAALQAVERSTEKAESAKVDGSVRMGSMSMTMDGAIDWADGLVGALSMVQKGGAQQLGDGRMQARYTPDAMFVNMGPQLAKETDGRHWLKYAYDDLSKLSGASGDVLRDQLQNNNPTHSVQMLLASGDVKKVGTETVAGQSTTHYSGTVDIGDFTEKSSKTLSDEQLREFKDQLEKTGLTSERIDIWVNDKDLLVKKEESADTAQGPFKTTVVYSDYGTDVQVSEPEASDTVDFLELLKKQQGQ